MKRILINIKKTTMKIKIELEISGIEDWSVDWNDNIDAQIMLREFGLNLSDVIHSNLVIERENIRIKSLELERT